MGATAEPARREPAALLLNRLRERLERADRLTVEVRRALRSADVEAIDESTARLDTLALEFKLLDAEYRRLPSRAEATNPPELVEAVAALQKTTRHLARSAAIGGGLLERLISMSRQLVETFHAGSGQPYLPSGRTRERVVEGVRLKEKA